MKVFISQPMKGLSKEEILRKRQEAKLHLFLELNSYNIEFIDAYMRYSNPILSIGESIKNMAEVDVVYFMRGWEKHRGCRIEHEVAVQYGIRCILYEG
jgi:hypothetical protein